MKQILGETTPELVGMSGEERGKEGGGKVPEEGKRQKEGEGGRGGGQVMKTGGGPGGRKRRGNVREGAPFALPSLPGPPICSIFSCFPAATYKELMDYLGRDKQMAQTQLLLLGDERARLRHERDTALQQVQGLGSWDGWRFGAVRMFGKFVGKR